jgi:hypothetical protein
MGRARQSVPDSGRQVPLCRGCENKRLLFAVRGQAIPLPAEVDSVAPGSQIAVCLSVIMKESIGGSMPPKEPRHLFSASSGAEGTIREWE